MSQPPEIPTESQSPQREPMPYDQPQYQEPLNHPYNQQQMNTPPPNSGLAITSMVCSILGLLTCGLTTLPGIIMGHIAHSKIKRSQGTVGGKGFAIAGIAVGYSSFILVIPALAAISSPIIMRNISRSRATTALSNSKDIYMGLRSYANQNDGNLPAKNPDFSGSNEYFRTFFENEIFYFEQPFYIKGMDGAVQPDENKTGANALSRGENCFAYVPGVNLVNAHSNTPLLAAPLINVGGTIEVDADAFGGQLLVLNSDGSAKVFQVESPHLVIDQETSRVVFKDGKLYGGYSNADNKGYEVIAPDL